MVGFLVLNLLSILLIVFKLLVWVVNVILMVLFILGFWLIMLILILFSVKFLNSFVVILVE